jgi:hypothetical protein
MALTRTELSDPNCTVTDGDYDAILAAIMETSRGRWFLGEYARRNRSADTHLVLTEINKLNAKLDARRTQRQYTVETSYSLRFNAAPLRSPFVLGATKSVAPQSYRSNVVPRAADLLATSSDAKSSSQSTRVSYQEDAFDFRTLKQG